MANASIMGGSPLGIIGVKSYYDTKSGKSTYNANDSVQFNVRKYNKNERSGVFTDGKKGNAMLSGYKYISYNRKNQSSSFYKDSYYKNGKTNNHSDELYDTSVNNIITRLSNTKAQLRPTDFAYLKNIGVYPNNRLIIARRFSMPVGDNIFIKGANSKSDNIALATLISWFKQDDDSFTVSFGEEWEEAKADFKDVFNKLGNDFNNVQKTNVGNFLGEAINAVPLTGFMEVFEREFLAKLGVINDTDIYTIPEGNPNLIKTAKRRKTIAAGESGSGLSLSVSISMECEYELKYISGVDPTYAWIDIISNIVRFGTSDHSTYGMSGNFVQKMNAWMDNPNDMLSEIVGDIKDILNKIKDEIASYSPSTSTETTDQTPIDALKERAYSYVNSLIEKISGAEIQKYRVEIMGILDCLSGMPSTPWHVTIGNPLRPIFASGDMLVKTVELTLGNKLAFNDLPSSIKAKFTIENARPWGMDELLAKLNSGFIRTIKARKSYFETGSTVVKNANDTKTSTIESYGNLDDYDYVPPKAVAGTTPKSSTAASTTDTTSADAKISNNDSGNKKKGSKKDTKANANNGANVKGISATTNNTKPVKNLLDVNTYIKK